jgi:2-amino-4-hydroxy-6-hydroxymethyldihydropteridine diphosphokinase
METLAYIALGSNMGDREEHVDAAVAAVRALPGVLSVAVSPVYETDPVVAPGAPTGQGQFLNCVAAVKTTLNAEQLLVQLNKIELERGRPTRAEREDQGPRPLDLDIVLFGDEVIDQPGLKVPHPRMHERTFVLKPLCDLAPDVTHPVLKRTAAQMLADLEEPLG